MECVSTDLFYDTVQFYFPGIRCWFMWGHTPMRSRTIVSSVTRALVGLKTSRYMHAPTQVCGCKLWTSWTMTTWWQVVSVVWVLVGFLSLVLLFCGIFLFCTTSWIVLEPVIILSIGFQRHFTMYETTDVILRTYFHSSVIIYFFLLWLF
jgi:hypothetical protein